MKDNKIIEEDEIIIVGSNAWLKIIYDLFGGALLKEEKEMMKSKYAGVSWHSRNRKWRTQIFIDKKSIHLGYYEDEIDAHLIFKTAFNNTDKYRDDAKSFKRYVIAQLESE